MKKILLSLVAGFTLAAPVAQAQTPVTPITDNIKVVAGLTALATGACGLVYMYKTCHKKIKAAAKITFVTAAGIGGFTLASYLAIYNVCSTISHFLEKDLVFWPKYDMRLTPLGVIGAAIAGYWASSF